MFIFKLFFNGIATPKDFVNFPEFQNNLPNHFFPTYLSNVLLNVFLGLGLCMFLLMRIWKTLFLFFSSDILFILRNKIDKVVLLSVKSCVVVVIVVVVSWFVSFYCYFYLYLYQFYFVAFVVKLREYLYVYIS